MRLGRILGDVTSVEEFERVKNTGLEFGEICCNFDHDNYSIIEHGEKIKANTDATGIDISCLGRWNHELLKDGTIDREKLKNYCELLDTAVYLGAKTFVCGCNYDSSISLYKNYTNMIEVFGTIVDYAADKNIKVAIQNCDWNNFVVSPEQWKIILGEIPNLYIKYDASHAYCRGCDYLAEISDWGERIAHVHIKGTTIAGERDIDDPPAGMDDLKWSSIFSILYSRGYDGDLSIEPHSDTWRGEKGQKGIEFTTRYIKNFIM